MRFKSLKIKVLFWFSLLSFIVLVIFSFSFYYFFEKSLFLTIQNELYVEAVNIKEHIDNRAWGKIKHKFPFAILEGNKIVYGSKNFELKNLGVILNSQKIFKIIDDGEYQNAIYIQKVKKPFYGAILVLKKEIDNRLENIISTMSILMPLLLLLLV
ncbi:MAG: hypothetical protein GXP61_04240, partial [Epsilonproteobacteria bacterium]|nr:hypothetical protein [Campylobacterota bacterium]